MGCEQYAYSTCSTCATFFIFCCNGYALYEFLLNYVSIIRQLYGAFTVWKSWSVKY